MENPTLPQQARRIAAVDVFRALTMFLMLFVNDIPGLREVPHWLFHARADEDMMGFSDTIFPAFLFCMGMAVPLAVQARYRKGDSPLQVVAHLFWRTLALIVMGLFTLNAGGVEGGLTYEWFSVLMVIGFFLTWAIYPKATGGRKLLYTAMKTAGIALLLFLVIYRDAHGAPFETGWWGILGLIGWTYAVCAVIYLFTGDNLRLNTIAWLVVVLLSVLNHMHEPPSGFAWQMLTLSFIPGDWTLHALGMSGVVATLLMQRYATPERPGRFAAILCALGAVMLILALLCHPHWIISKIQATPTWLFYCLAMYFPLFALFYWLTDTRGKASWFRLIKPAGTATLTCYILPYLWYPLESLLGVHYPAALDAGVPGLLKSVVFSLVIVLLTGLLVKGKVKLKV